VFGFALLPGGRSLQVRDGGGIECRAATVGTPDPGCPLVETDPLPFAPARAPR
jgi:hypothetical protein